MQSWLHAFAQPFDQSFIASTLSDLCSVLVSCVSISIQLMRFLFLDGSTKVALHDMSNVQEVAVQDLFQVP